MFSLSGCGSRHEPFFEQYVFDFDSNYFDEAVNIVEELSDKWSLDRYHMNLNQASLFSKGEKAFDISLYVRGKKHPVANIANIGVPKAIAFYASRNRGFDENQLRSFSDDVLNTFQKQNWAKLRE